MRADITFVQCPWEEIHPFVADYIKANGVTVESFWEDHVLRSNHYKIISGGETAGYFAVHKGETVLLFNVFADYADKAQEMFTEVKKCENVTNAMVPTGDEFFLSHCFDNFARIEKQAYFAVYTEKDISPERRIELSFRLADIERDYEILESSGLFPDDEIEKVSNGEDYLYVYIAEYGGNDVGFGVIEYGRIIKDMASIGMFVLEPYRRRGIAANILRQLKQTAQSKGCGVFSGCWYYNHNSKKTMESAGAYSKTRLIRFYF